MTASWLDTDAAERLPTPADLIGNPDQAVPWGLPPKPALSERYTHPVHIIS